ncbi:MAG: T9SS type A sorting domain-containing protein, partial [Bacteroidia bacterium]
GQCGGRDTITMTNYINVNGNLNTSTSSTNISCFGANDGSATANATGGNTPYTYQWSSGQTTQTINGLAPGQYSVTITDAAGCSNIEIVTITQPSQLGGSITVIDETCSGANGSLTANPIGGTAPYTYSWNTSPVQTTQTISNLSAGIYTVTITDANNCTTTLTDTVINSGSLSLSTSTNNETCNGANGSATVTVNGGTTPYNYAWNTSPVQNTSTATNLSAGSYSVTVTDANNCSQTATINIFNIGNTTVTASPNQTICSGNSVTLSANASGGTGPYTYVWNPGNQTGNSITVSPTSTTTYSVVATDANNCSGSATTTVNVTPIPVTVVTPTNVTICIGQSTVLTASGGTTYVWSTGGTNATETVNPTATTTYSVIAFNGSCMGNTATATVTVSPCLSIDEEGVENIVVLYPNPSSGLINIEIGTLKSNNFKIHVFNSIGEIVQVISLNDFSNNRYTVDLSSKANGLYYFTFHYENEMFTKKVSVIK